MRIIERIRPMSNIISSSLALLVSSVKPVNTASLVTDSIANPATKAAGFTGGTLNTFALSVLAETLEGTESLVQPDNTTSQAGADNIVEAGLTGSAIVSAKYLEAQALTLKIPTPSTDIQS